MPKRIAIIQGHPDPRGIHFGHALAAAYSQGARDGGHETKRIEVAKLDFPLLRSQEDFEHGAPPDAIRQAQETINWADHVVIFFPLWMGTMPALLKGFLEQVFRPAFASDPSATGGLPKGRLKGKSARIIVTMGMPAFFYRLYFLAHGVRGLESGVLRLAGFGPIRESLIGSVDAANPAQRGAWLKKMRVLGRKGE